MIKWHKIPGSKTLISECGRFDIFFVSKAEDSQSHPHYNLRIDGEVCESAETLREMKYWAEKFLEIEREEVR